MAIAVTTSLPRDRREKILREIDETSQNTPELTPRPISTLRQLAESGNLVAAFTGDELAGWGVREPLGRGVVELGMAYVKPRFRKTNAFELLVRELTNCDEACLFATYLPGLIRYTVREHGFRESSLGEFAIRSRGRFIFNRLSPARRRAVRTHLATARPLYAIREGRR